MKAPWILVTAVLVSLPVGNAAPAGRGAEARPASDGASYPVGTVVSLPCKHEGAIPQDTQDVESGVETYESTKLVTPRGDEKFVSPPDCEPATLTEPGHYTATVGRITTHWKKSYESRLKQTSGAVKKTDYFSKTSDSDIRIYRFAAQAGPAPAAEPASPCPTPDSDWEDRIEEEADAYVQALEQNLNMRTTIQSLQNERNNSNDVARRVAEAMWSDIEEGLDGLRDDCVRLARALNDLRQLCEKVTDCSEDLAAVMADGPGSTCLSVHEALTSFRGGANSNSQAYGWFKRDMPCLAHLYDEDDFKDFIEALAGARQPLAGFHTRFDGSPREPAAD